MTAIILSAIRHWKSWGFLALCLVFLVTAYLAQERGRERDALRREMKHYRQISAAQISALQQAYTEEKNRHDFMQTQIRTLGASPNNPVLFDDAVRSAYDRLRERQAAGHISR